MKTSRKHVIYPNLKEFFCDGWFTDLTLKKEYRCSKCKETIILKNYDKLRRKSDWIRGFILGISVLVALNIDDIISLELMERLLSDFSLPELLLRVLTSFFKFVIIWIPVLIIDYLLIWLDRVRMLKKYCSTIEDCSTYLG